MCSGQHIFFFCFAQTKCDIFMGNSLISVSMIKVYWLYLSLLMGFQRDFLFLWQTQFVCVCCVLCNKWITFNCIFWVFHFLCSCWVIILFFREKYVEEFEVFRSFQINHSVKWPSWCYIIYIVLGIVNDILRGKKRDIIHWFHSNEIEHVLVISTSLNFQLIHDHDASDGATMIDNEISWSPVNRCLHFGFLKMDTRERESERESLSPTQKPTKYFDLTLFI